MIPRTDINAWRKFAAWQLNEQVEQDLILCRSLIEIFSDSQLNRMLAFRGGTALYKLYLKPAVRYSEDLDLVQVKKGPIGPIFDRLREKMSFLGVPTVKQTRGNNTFIFRFESEIPPIVRMRLKLEINCREQFSVYSLVKIPFNVNSRWFDGECQIVTYDLNELLATKLRALYQRRKGRDLFDLWHASNNEEFSSEKIIHAFNYYMDFISSKVSSAKFEKNLREKLEHRDFLTDTKTLILPATEYNLKLAGEWCIENLISKIP